MKIPTQMDWAKIPRILAGTWPQPVPPRIIATPGDPASVDAAVSTLENATPEYAVIDTEYGRESKFLTLLGMGFRTGSELVGVQIEWPHLSWWQKRRVAEAVKTLVGRTRVIFQNLLADIPVLEQAMAIAPGDYKQVDDLLLAHAVLWSEWPHDLEFLASLYGQHPKMKHLSESDPLLYNWGDVLDTDSAWQAVEAELGKDPQSANIYRNQSLPIALRSLLPAKRRGIRINLDRVRTANLESVQMVDRAARLAQAWVGWPLNLGSSLHVSRYLYSHAGLALQKHKKTKKATIDADAIATLRMSLTPVPDLEEEERNGLTFDQALTRIEDGADPILEARVLFAGARQIESHYIRPALQACGRRLAPGPAPVGDQRASEAHGGSSPSDGRFYPEFLLHAQASGRWSTNNPPLAQLPEDLRDIIGPDPGTTWLGWDWAQIEPRILEALAKDEDALARWNEDRYLRFTSIFFPHATRDHPMWDHYRKFTKRKILKLHYGGRPDSLTPGAAKLGLDKKLETQASLRYLASRPRLTEWQRRTAAEALRTRVSRTFMGRLRRLTGDANTIVGQAYDHPMQGGVSDIYNLTHVRIVEELPWLWWVYGAHDNQWWGCPNERVEETWPTLKAIVEQPWTINGTTVPFPAVYKERARA